MDIRGKWLFFIDIRKNKTERNKSHTYRASFAVSATYKYHKEVRLVCRTSL